MSFDWGLHTDGDLALSDIGELTVLTGRQLVQQRLSQRMQSIRGEWFFDVSWGVDYLNKVLVKRPNLPLIQAIFTELITTTPGVTRMTAFSITYSSVTLTLAIDFACLTDEGESIAATAEQEDGGFFLLLF